MALEGFLEEFGLADILQLIYFQKKTGILHIHGKTDRIKLIIVNGNITGLESEKRSEENRLGKILIKKGLLTPDNLDHALELQKKENIRLAQILFKQGIVSKEVLIETIQNQIIDNIAQIFAWTEGRYEFIPQEIPAELPVSLDTQHLLMDSLRTVDEWSLVEGKLNLDTVFRLKKVPEPGQLNEAEEAILNLIDGESDVSTIISIGSLGDLETSKALISLEKKGIIAKVPSGPGEKEERGPAKISKTPFIIAALTIAVVVIIFSAFKGHLGAFKMFKEARTISEIERLKTKIDIYNVTHGRYPEDIKDVTVKTDAWGTPYIYKRTKDGFKLFSAGPDRIEGTEDDVY